MRKKVYLLGILLFLAISICGCDSTKKTDTSKYSQEIFAMDTYMTVTAYGNEGEKAVELAEKEIKRLDALLSTGDTNSEIFKINTNKSAKISSDTEYLFSRSCEINESTNGLFDIAIYPVMEEWGFTSGNYSIPSENKLAELLNNVDMQKIKYDPDSKELRLNKDMAIDFGGIAKGYTSGRIMDIFRECGVESGLVSLGGNVQLFGKKPDGSDWMVGIQNPEDSTAYIGVLKAHDVAVITSGGYERYFEKNGQKYHHIIDPRTGYPADSGLKSVTIISADGTLADGLSTSLYIMGEALAIEYWKSHNDEFEMILMRDDDVVVVSEGIKDYFESDYEIKIAKAN